MAIEWGIPLLVGGIPTPLQNISQIGSSSQLLGKTKNVPNHQPDYNFQNHGISTSWDNPRWIQIGASSILEGKPRMLGYPKLEKQVNPECLLHMFVGALHWSTLPQHLHGSTIFKPTIHAKSFRVSSHPSSHTPHRRRCRKRPEAVRGQNPNPIWKMHWLKEQVMNTKW